MVSVIFLGGNRFFNETRKALGTVMHMEKSTALFVVFVRCFCPVVSCGDFVR